MKSQKLISSMMLLFFLYLTLLYRYRASDFQFPFGPSTSVLRLLPQAQAILPFGQAQAVLPFGQAQAELRDFKNKYFCDFRALTLTSTFGSV